MMLVSCCDTIMILTLMPVHHSIVDTLRKVLNKFEVNQTNISRVIAIHSCTSVPHNCYLLTANKMSTPPESASGSGIVVQVPINVPLPMYDQNAPDQMQEFQMFKCQFTSWKKICQIMSDEVDYLLSIISKEGYAAMDHWMPTDPADKNDAGKFLNYLESTLDDKIFPCVRVYELKDVRKRTDETIDALIDCICQLACHALIGGGSDATVEFEVQHRLIHAHSRW